MIFLFTHRGCLGRHPPQADTSSLGRHPPGQSTATQTPPLSRHPQADTPLGGHTPWADTPSGQILPLGRHSPQVDTPWADTPQVRHPPRGRHPPPLRDGLCSGWYVSYFPFFKLFSYCLSNGS